MAEKVYNVRVLQKQDFTDNWNSSPVILRNGEIGIEVLDSGKKKIKIGDGTNTWANLEYLETEAAANILDGIANGSIRTSSAAAETTDYRLGNAAFASGQGTKASGNFSKATNFGTNASGAYSSAEGRETQAKGSASHAGGYGTIAGGKNQTVIGKFNIEDTSEEYAFIIGDGESTDSRTNLFTVAWDGEVQVDGKKLATEEYVGQNGGKIDSISVNGNTQTISNKNVNITVPTKTSEITNDSNFATVSQIPTKVSQLENDKNYLTSHQDISGKAEKTYVDEQISAANKYTDDSVANLLNNSSEAVDSVMELAAAMENNKDAIDVLTEIAGKKVDKVDGKGLSTNDYTTEEKNQLANLKTIVGDTPVSTQISTALNDYAPDWNKMQNKPFDEETVVLVDNRTIPIQSDGFAQIEPPFTLVAGQEYIVIYNGTEYKVTAKEIIGSGITAVFVGNQLVVNGEDTGEPFAIGYTEMIETVSSITALDGSSEVVLTVIGTEVKTIDKKYLPEPLQFGETLIDGEKIIKPLETKYLPEHLQFGQTLIDGDTLIWDGERSGLTVVEYLGELWYHVSDSTPTMDDFANGGTVFGKRMTNEEDLGEQPLDSSMFREDNGMISIMDGYIEIIPEDNFTDGARTYPKAGTYFKWDSRNDIYIYSLVINDYNGYGKIVDTIDKKYLPPFIEKEAALLNLNPVGSGSFSMNRETDTETGIYSVALGWRPTASGPYSYAEGYLATASGFVSHAEGYCTMANGDYSHVQGKYNIADEENKYAHIVGNGASSYNSNAHTLDWRGNAWFAGDVYVGSTLGSNKDEGSKKLATEEFVNQSLQNFTSGTQVQILTWEAND